MVPSPFSSAADRAARRLTVAVLPTAVLLAVALDPAAIAGPLQDLSAIGETLRQLGTVADQVARLLGVLAQVLTDVGDALASGL